MTRICDLLLKLTTSGLAVSTYCLNESHVVQGLRTFKTGHIDGIYRLRKDMDKKVLDRLQEICQNFRSETVKYVGPS